MRQAVILAGGKGTRLTQVSNNLPKPMVPILGKPLLQYLIELCVQNQILDIKLLVSYKKDVIKKFFGDGSKYGVKIQYIIEESPKGTAGALFDAINELNEQFLVIYGDTFLDIDLESFLKFHQKKKGDVTIFLHPNDHPYDSDLVEINSDYQVNKIHSYPHGNKWHQNLVNAALYIFNKDSFKNLSFSSDNTDIAKDLFPFMLESKKKIYGYISTEYIKDMGTPNRLRKVENDIKNRKVLLLKKNIPKIAIFIDRDGTINKEVDHLSSHEKFELIDGVGQAISKINSKGILSIVITNQPVIARGELSEFDLKIIHNKMDTLLGKQGAYIDRLYYCPHHQDGGFEGENKSLKFDCDCRKPKIGMFLQAKIDLNINLKKSWIVGDSTSDILAARKAGMMSVLVLTGYAGKDGKHKVTPDYIAKDLNEAVNLILSQIKHDN